MAPVQALEQSWRDTEARLAGFRSLNAGHLCGRLDGNQLSLVSKGGDPAAPSDTATLLRLHPSHESHRGNRPPCG